MEGGRDFCATSGSLRRSYPTRSSLVDIGSRFGPRPNGWVVEEDGYNGIRAFGRTRKDVLDDFMSKVARRVIDHRRVSMTTPR